MLSENKLFLQMNYWVHRIRSIIIIFLIIGSVVSANSVMGNSPAPKPAGLEISESYFPTGQPIYLPLIFRSGPSNSPTQDIPRINIPFFPGDLIFSETAIFWFGRVTNTENYIDVRVGYTESELWVYLVIFDRRLWYDPSPSPSELVMWDAASMYLNLAGNHGSQPGRDAYRFTGQLNWWEPRSAYQAAYQGNGSGWELTSIPFTTKTGWAGYPQPNDDGDDRGWSVAFKIPYDSLGLSGPPPPGTVWGLAFDAHDRDDPAGTPNADATWPPEMNSYQPDTWGQLSFVLPVYTPHVGETSEGQTIIRNKLNDATVVDGMVGGSSTCGEGLDYWTEWGEKNYAGADQVNVQNEGDYSDWPCFSKFYLTFPLESIPSGKEIISAKLTLYSIGNAGGSQWSDPVPSLIQVMTVAEDWEEATLNWNNAPLVLENVSRTWVDPITNWPGWPGVPRTWDVSYAAHQAYISGEPLRLVLYSADNAYHSGRYFTSSDVGDWDETGRPTLEVIWGNP